MFKSNIWPKPAPLQDLSDLRNLSDLEFDLSRSLKVSVMVSFTLHVWFSIDIYGNYMSVSHRLALIAGQNVFSYLLLVPITKNRKCTKGPQNVTWSKVHHICTTSTRESQIPLRLALRPLIFQIIAGFWFLHKVKW